MYLGFVKQAVDPPLSPAPSFRRVSFSLCSSLLLARDTLILGKLRAARPTFVGRMTVPRVFARDLRAGYLVKLRSARVKSREITKRVRRNSMLNFKLCPGRDNIPRASATNVKSYTIVKRNEFVYFRKACRRYSHDLSVESLKFKTISHRSG